MGEKKKLDILLVEDSAVHATLIFAALAELPGQPRLHVATTLHDARAHLQHIVPDLAIIDLLLPDGKGSELLPGNGDALPWPAIIMTSHGDEQQAVEAMKGGALDYLVKSPEVLTNLPHVVERTLREWDHLRERRAAEEALRESEARFRSIFEYSANAVFLFSAAGEFLQVNPASCRIFALSEEELLHGRLFELLHAADRDLFCGLISELLANQRDFVEGEYRFVRSLGGTLWGHVTVSLVRTAAGHPYYCIGQMVDITHRKEAEESLRAANRELDAFVATVSHDLRAPLSPIIGYADYLRHLYKERLDDEALHFLDEIITSGQSMSTLIEDLLALARVGKLDLPVAAVDVDAVADEAVMHLSKELQRHAVSVTIAPLPKLFVPRSLLLQLFTNLIGNAARYGGKPGDTIVVDGARDGERVRLCVRDHGAGIAEEERVQVFEVFYRGSSCGEKSGSGIGLATVRKIARLYGGEAWVEETPGGGATFCVELIDRPPVA